MITLTPEEMIEADRMEDESIEEVFIFLCDLLCKESPHTRYMDCRIIENWHIYDVPPRQRYTKHSTNRPSRVFIHLERVIPTAYWKINRETKKWGRKKPTEEVRDAMFQFCRYVRES